MLHFLREHDVDFIIRKRPRGCHPSQLLDGMCAMCVCVCECVWLDREIWLPFLSLKAMLLPVKTKYIVLLLREQTFKNKAVSVLNASTSYWTLWTVLFGAKISAGLSLMIFSAYLMFSACLPNDSGELNTQRSWLLKQCWEPEWELLATNFSSNQVSKLLGSNQRRNHPNHPTKSERGLLD